MSSFLKTLGVAATLAALLIPLQAQQIADPLLHYTFEGSGMTISNEGTLKDASLSMYAADGTSSDLRVRGGRKFARPGEDTALHFNATMTIPGPWAQTNGPIPDFPSLDALSITFWAKIRKWSAGASVLRMIDGKNSGLRLLLDSSFSLRLSMGDSSEQRFYPSPPNAYAWAEKEWTFFAVVWDGQAGVVSFYRSAGDPGSEVALVGQETIPSYRLSPPECPLFVGNTNANQKDRALDGMLEDLRLYPQSLTVEQLAEVRQAGLQ